MREIDPDLIKQHTAVRFRSEYDYALFEYYRSAKVIALLDRAGVTLRGRALDCGCGGGGMPMSLAEHVARRSASIPSTGSGTRASQLARERGMRNLTFLQADGMALPFRSGSFDLVLSHAVIEHVPDAMRYLQECRRVMAPDGRMYLSTAPYLSFAGAHLPRLLVPVPLHWIVGRRIAFRTFRWLARRAPWTLQGAGARELVHPRARQGIVKHDDLLEKVRVQRLRPQIAQAGFRIVHEQLHASGTVRRLPSRNGRVAPRQRADAGLPAQQHRVRAGPAPASELVGADVERAVDRARHAGEVLHVLADDVVVGQHGRVQDGAGVDRLRGPDEMVVLARLAHEARRRAGDGAVLVIVPLGLLVTNGVHPVLNQFCGQRQPAVVVEHLQVGPRPPSRRRCCCARRCSRRWSTGGRAACCPVRSETTVLL